MVREDNATEELVLNWPCNAIINWNSPWRSFVHTLTRLPWSSCGNPPLEATWNGPDFLLIRPERFRAAVRSNAFDSCCIITPLPWLRLSFSFALLHRGAKWWKKIKASTFQCALCMVNKLNIWLTARSPTNFT